MKDVVERHRSGKTAGLATVFVCIGVAACMVFCCFAQAQQDTSLAAKAGYILPEGTVRIVGSKSMQGVVEKLNALFVQQHPGVRFRYEPSDNNGAIDALIFDATPFAPVGTIYGGGIAYSDIVKAPPFSVRIAHGSLAAQAEVSPLAVIVNPANPLEKLSITDLAAIFSKPPRARVFSQWAQMRVDFPAGAQDIEPAGLPWSDHYASEDRSFSDDVFFRKFGGAAPVDDYRMFKTYAEVVRFVAREPGAIGIVETNQVTPAVKIVGLTDGPFAATRKPTADDIRSGHYPLDRCLYINARVQAGKPLDPLVRDYLRMALSPEGQAAIAAEGEGYLPLNATEVSEEESKFE